MKTSFTPIGLRTKKSQISYEGKSPARGQGKACFTLPVGRVKHALPSLSCS